MKTAASFVVGVAVGWGVRAVFDSRRDALVSLTAAAYRAVEAARRHGGFEREYFEDLVAEGKAKWEADRRRRAEAAAAQHGVARDRSGEGAKP